MKDLFEITSFIRNVVDGRECDFNDTENRYLRQFGIKVLTGMREADDARLNPETELDRMKRAAGHVGYNDSSVVDFVCEKNDLMFSIVVAYGQWFLGNDILWKGRLLSADNHENALGDEPVGYDPMDLHKFELYGTGYCLPSEPEESVTLKEAILRRTRKKIFEHIRDGENRKILDELNKLYDIAYSKGWDDGQAELIPH